MGKQYYGPIINDITNNFSSRDSLGIESVSTSISAELCPIVNTVTPRAFYWAFMCWIYYDFYKNSGIREWTRNAFDQQFLKRQDYFFVLSNLLLKEAYPDLKVDENNLVGKVKTALDIQDNKTGPYGFNKDYFKTMYGGMQYYNAGCLTMHFVTNEDENGDVIKGLPRLTQYGERMALSFEEVIKDTRYYKEYRLTQNPVPKEVLIEYGKVINLGLRGFENCKGLLRHHLFERNRQLTKCADYARLIRHDSGMRRLSADKARYFLFDYYSPVGEKNDYPAELQQMIVGWEIAVGRQYFTAGIEAIWKYLLNILSEPMTQDEWINRALDTSLFSFSIEKDLEQIIPECRYRFQERETMVERIRRSKKGPGMIEIGLRLALSIYNRFLDRDDLGEAEKYLDYGRGRIQGMGSLSFGEWADLIAGYRKKTVREFLIHVMKDCIIAQHVRTCYDKLMRPSGSVYGFFFDKVNDKYLKNQFQFQVDFQGIRFVQLMQVMQDLDLFDEAVGR